MKKKNVHWKVISSKTVAKNPFMILKESLVERPNGNILPYYHLNQLHFSVVIPVDNKKFTYLVGQYRFAIKQYSWEFPMGHVHNSSPKKMAEIELSQETGISAKKFTYLGEFYIGNANSDQKASVYLAQDLTFGKSHSEANEFLEIKKVSLKNIAEMIKKGEITDGPSIGAFQLFNLNSKKHLSA